MKHNLGISLLLIITVLTGCATTNNTTLPQLLPGADQIRVDTQVPDGDNCQPITHITSKQIAQPMDARILEKAAMTQLKNTALYKGANYIYETHNYSNVTDNSLGANRVSGVTVKGVAYHCDTLPPEKS